MNDLVLVFAVIVTMVIIVRSSLPLLPRASERPSRRFPRGDPRPNAYGVIPNFENFSLPSPPVDTCHYCGASYPEEFAATCPSCGAPSRWYQRRGEGQRKGRSISKDCLEWQELRADGRVVQRTCAKFRIPPPGPSSVMIRSLALVFLMLFATTPDVSAKKHIQPNDRGVHIQVVSSLPPQYEPILWDQVRAWNRMSRSVKAGITLHRTCPKRVRRCGRLQVSVGYNPQAYGSTQHAGWLSGWILIGSWVKPEDFQSTLCHEMAHFMTYAGDGAQRNDNSCLYGKRAYPGPTDRALLRKAHPRPV
jgi:hypothetical protein